MRPRPHPAAVEAEAVARISGGVKAEFALLCLVRPSALPIIQIATVRASAVPLKQSVHRCKI